MDELRLQLADPLVNPTASLVGRVLKLRVVVPDVNWGWCLDSEDSSQEGNTSRKEQSALRATENQKMSALYSVIFWMVPF